MAELPPLLTLEQVRKTYRLSKADAQLKLDQLTKERNALLAQQAAQQAEAQRNATEAARVQAEADAKRAAAQAEAERVRQAGAEAAAKRKAEEDRIARENSPYNQGRQLVENIGAPLVGYGVGHHMGSISDARMNAVEAQRAANLDKLMAGANKLTPYSADDIATAKAKVAAARRQGLTSGRGLGQFMTPSLLALMGTGTIAGSRYLDNEYARDASQAFGRGEQLSGLGMALKQAYDTKHRIDPLNANSVAGLERLRGFPDEPLPPPPSAEPPAASEAPVASETAPKAKGKAKGPKYTAEQLEPKTATELKKLYQEENPGKKLPVAKAGVGGLKSALIDKLTTASGIAGLAIASTVYDAMRTPAKAEDGSTNEGASAPVAAATAAGAGYGAYKGVDAITRALDTAGKKAAPYAEKTLGSLAPYAGKAAGLLGNVAGRIAPPVAVGQLAYSAGAPSDTSSPEDERAAISGFSHPEDELRNITTSRMVANGTPGVSVASPETAQAFNPNGYHHAVDDEHHLADQAMAALQRRPEAMGDIIQRTHDIAQARGWDPSVIGKIIGARMEQPEAAGAQ